MARLEGAEWARESRVGGEGAKELNSVEDEEE